MRYEYEFGAIDQVGWMYLCCVFFGWNWSHIKDIFMKLRLLRSTSLAATIYLFGCISPLRSIPFTIRTTSMVHSSRFHILAVSFSYYRLRNRLRTTKNCNCVYFISFPPNTIRLVLAAIQVRNVAWVSIQFHVHRIRCDRRKKKFSKFFCHLFVISCFFFFLFSLLFNRSANSIGQLFNSIGKSFGMKLELVCSFVVCRVRNQTIR